MVIRTRTTQKYLRLSVLLVNVTSNVIVRPCTLVKPTASVQLDTENTSLQHDTKETFA